MKQRRTTLFLLSALAIIQTTTLKWKVSESLA